MIWLSLSLSLHITPPQRSVSGARVIQADISESHAKMNDRVNVVFRRACPGHLQGSFYGQKVQGRSTPRTGWLASLNVDFLLGFGAEANLQTMRLRSQEQQPGRGRRNTSAEQQRERNAHHTGTRISLSL
jgi:hypothetical protein